MSAPIRWNMKDAVCDAYEVKNAVSSSLHGHHHFLITLITRGQGVQTLNGQDVSFQTDDLFVLSPADFHKNTVKDGESYDYFGVKFPYELIDRCFSEWCSFENFPIHVSLSSSTARTLRSVFALLVSECADGGASLASDSLKRALLEEIFILAAREFPVISEGCSKSFINRTLGYLYSNFLEDISVSSAASYVGYTPNHFNTVFRSAFGVPFGTYLRNMRLDYAKKLLTADDRSLAEIALESGFGSLSHFSRTFSTSYGISPQEYRKKEKQSALLKGTNS